MLLHHQEKFLPISGKRKHKLEMLRFFVESSFRELLVIAVDDLQVNETNISFTHVP